MSIGRRNLVAMTTSLCLLLALLGFSQPRVPNHAAARRHLGEKRELLSLKAEKREVRYDQPDEAQRFFAMKRLPPGEIRLPVEKYLEALEQMKGMPQHSTSLNISFPSRNDIAFYTFESALGPLGTWTPLGPGNIGGRTRALLIDPTNRNVMYAAGVAGGVWKTTDGGNSWFPLADLMANLAVCSMAMNPRNPDVIYAGTGEGYFNIDAVRGAGIFKTTDAGATWTHLASTGNADFYYVNDIVVSPINPQRVYAATRTGVWRSTDGGTKWTRVRKGVGNDGCLDLAIRTDQPSDYLFVSCGNFSQTTIYRSKNAEGSGAWSAVFTERGMGRTSLAIAPSNQNVIYALSDSLAKGDYQYGLHAVFRSNSSGNPGTWIARVRNTSPVKLNTVLLTNPIYAFLRECGYGASEFVNQGWYDNVIAVDPADPERVWVGGIDLFRSDDGGANWGLASHWWADYDNPRYAHADHHAIVFHPEYNGTTNRILFVGTDAGVFRTDDARAPVATGSDAVCSTSNGMVKWRALNNNYGVTQFYHGVPFPDGRSYFGGTQDTGTILGTDQQGADGWSEILGGDGGYVAVDQRNPSVLYATNPNGDVSKSTDGGLSFRSANVGLFDLGFEFIAPLIMDPSNSQRLWTGGFYLWRTTNGAMSWNQASKLTTGNGSVSAIGIAPTNPNNVLAGMSDGYILRTNIGITSNAGTEWAFARPRAGYVSSITFDPTNANIAYATYSTFGGTHVWKSTNAGSTWKGIDGSGSGRIPDLPVHTIVVDPANPSRLFIGTDLGVFVSTDGGATWAVENTGFANVITEALAIGTVGSIPHVFAFTHGRGAWRVPIR